MTCNHAKINDSDWSDTANVDAATQELNFSTPAFRRVSTLTGAHKCENVFTI